MTDRFKFRVYIKYAKMMCYDVNGFYIDRLKNKITIYFDDGHTKTFKFDDVVLEQSTGLKDKNGKLIYEGDVIEVGELYASGIYKIEFCQSDCSYNLYNAKGDFIYLLTKSVAKYNEVIGNIHESANLLENY